LLAATQRFEDHAAIVTNTAANAARCYARLNDRDGLAVPSVRWMA
jgi:hypothetical protein